MRLWPSACPPATHKHTEQRRGKKGTEGGYVLLSRQGPEVGLSEEAASACPAETRLNPAKGALSGGSRSPPTNG